MIGLALRRLGEASLTLLFISLFTFLMGRSIPGGPFDGEKYQPPQVKKLQEEKYGFDKPPLAQFITYASGVFFHLDFGVSLKFLDRPVGAIILETMPISLILGGLALVMALAVGFPLGMISALKPNTRWDTAALFLAISGITLPTFLIGALLVLVFCHFLNWLPPARLDSPSSYLLPVITLGMRPAAIVARMVRASLMDEMKMDYIRTARAKGANERIIILRHALRNSLLPLVAVLGPVAANILTGSFITEQFFAIPGMAKHFIEAVNNRDSFLFMGVTLVFGVLLISINLISDLLYPILDPRMRKTR